MCTHVHTHTMCAHVRPHSQHAPPGLQSHVSATTNHVKSLRSAAVGLSPLTDPLPQSSTREPWSAHWLSLMGSDGAQRLPVRPRWGPWAAHMLSELRCVYLFSDPTAPVRPLCPPGQAGLGLMEESEHGGSMGRKSRRTSMGGCGWCSEESWLLRSLGLPAGEGPV